MIDRLGKATEESPEIIKMRKDAQRSLKLITGFCRVFKDSPEGIVNATVLHQFISGPSENPDWSNPMKDIPKDLLLAEVHH